MDSPFRIGDIFWHPRAGRKWVVCSLDNFRELASCVRMSQRSRGIRRYRLSFEYMAQCVGCGCVLDEKTGGATHCDHGPVLQWPKDSQA